eukprot:3074578-Lingulodinium_polyedra.AAC.1
MPSIWAENEADQEAVYVRPMTGATVSLAERIQGDMPDLPGAPDDFTEDLRSIEDAGSRWRA